MPPVARRDPVRARLVVNPFARNGHRLADLEEAEKVLREHGWEVTRVLADRPVDVFTACREAVEAGCNVVIVAGGDGSLGQAADALAGTDVALGIIPAGTGNILARDLGLPIPAPWYPQAFADAARILVTAEWWRVDVGRVDNGHRIRRFLNWCGAGFDALVTLRVEPYPEEKRRWGVAAYVLPAVQELFHYQPAQWRVEVDGALVEGRFYLAVTHNSQLYAGILRLAPEAYMDDGWLDLALISARTPQELIAAFSQLVLWHVLPQDNVRLYKAQRIHLEAAPPQPVHLDGDPLMETPVEITVEPQALTLLVPGGDRFPRHLFRETAALAPEKPAEVWLPW